MKSTLPPPPLGTQTAAMSCQRPALHSGVSIQDLNCIPPSVKTLISLLLPVGSFFVLETGKHRVYRPVGCSPTWHHGKRLVTSLLSKKGISFSCLPLCCALEAQSNKMSIQSHMFSEQQSWNSNLSLLKPKLFHS